MADRPEAPDRPSAAFLSACAAAEVAPEHREALWRVCRRSPGSPAEAERLALEDYAHFRLFEQSRNGDERAAARFEQTWRSYLRRYLGGRFPPDRVDELTSMFFERAYRSAGPAFRWECPFSSYLRRVALNLVRTQAKRGAARERRELSLDQPEAAYHETLPAGGPSPEESLLAAERQRQLGAALGELDPADLHILRRCLLDDEPGEEVARSLGIRRDALYQRINRARRRARALLGGRGLLSDPAAGRVKRK